jgi:hypothetical protein
MRANALLGIVGIRNPYSPWCIAPRGRGPLIQWSTAEESRKIITARSVLPRTGQIQSQQAAFP